MMYKELIQRLRETSMDFGEADHVSVMLLEAADAIKELLNAANFHKYNSEFWEGKYNTLVDEKWIPVTERLPDNIDEEVLVCNEGYGKDGTGFATVAVYNGNGWLECWERKQYLACITHWMPLPEPPKEET